MDGFYSKEPAAHAKYSDRLLGVRRGISFTLAAHALRKRYSNGWIWPVDGPETGSRRCCVCGGFRRHARGYFLRGSLGVGRYEGAGAGRIYKGSTRASERLAGLLGGRTRPPGAST